MDPLTGLRDGVIMPLPFDAVPKVGDILVRIRNISGPEEPWVAYITAVTSHFVIVLLRIPGDGQHETRGWFPQNWEYLENYSSEE